MANVAVIVPYYKTPLKFIRNTLKSILSQTYKDFNLYLIDDGSDEKEQKALTELISTFNDKRLILLRKENGGVADARFHGIKNSKERFIAFCDSDDLWHENKLERQIDYFQRNPDLDLIACHMEIVDMDGNIIGKRPVDRGRVKNSKKYEMVENFLLSNPFVTSSVLFKKEKYNDAIPYIIEDRNAVDDLSLWLAMAIAGAKFGFVDDYLGSYREGWEGNLSGSLTIGYDYNFKHIFYFLEVSRDILIRHGYDVDNLKRNVLYNAYVKYSGRLSDAKNYKSALDEIINALKYRITIKAIRRCAKYLLLSTFSPNRIKL